MTTERLQSLDTLLGFDMSRLVGELDISDHQGLIFLPRQMPFMILLRNPGC